MAHVFPFSFQSSATCMIGLHASASEWNSLENNSYVDLRFMPFGAFAALAYRSHTSMLTTKSILTLLQIALPVTLAYAERLRSSAAVPEFFLEKMKLDFHAESPEDLASGDILRRHYPCIISFCSTEHGDTTEGAEAGAAMATEFHCRDALLFLWGFLRIQLEVVGAMKKAKRVKHSKLFKNCVADKKKFMKWIRDTSAFDADVLGQLSDFSALYN